MQTSSENQQNALKVAEQAQKNGLNLIFDTSIGDNVNGANKGKVIVINSTSTESIPRGADITFNHEFFHSTEGSQAHKEIVDTINNLETYNKIAKELGFKGDRANYESFKKSVEKQYNPEEVNEEIGAFVMQEIAKNQNSVDKIVRSNESLAYSLFTKVQDAIDNARGSSEVKRLDQMLRKAFKENTIVATDKVKESKELNGVPIFDKNNIDKELDKLLKQNKGNYVKAITKYLNEKYRDKKILLNVGNIYDAGFNTKSSNEYAGSVNSRRDRERNNIKKDLMINLGSITVTAKYIGVAPNTKGNGSFKEFDYFEVAFGIKDSDNVTYYNGLLNIGINGQNVPVFYDITKIKESNELFDTKPSESIANKYKLTQKEGFVKYSKALNLKNYAEVKENFNNTINEIIDNSQNYNDAAVRLYEWVDSLDKDTKWFRPIQNSTIRRVEALTKGFRSQTEINEYKEKINAFNSLEEVENERIALRKEEADAFNKRDHYEDVRTRVANQKIWLDNVEKQLIRKDMSGFDRSLFESEELTNQQILTLNQLRDIKYEYDGNNRIKIDALSNSGDSLYNTRLTKEQLKEYFGTDIANEIISTVNGDSQIYVYNNGINEEIYDDETFVRDIVRQARKDFGTTTNYNVVGYIDLDGKMIDFSGARQGGSGYSREMDHREMNPSGISWYDYVKMGNIRMFPESGGFELEKKPTEAQQKALIKFLQNNKFARTEGSFIGISKSIGKNNIGRNDVANLVYENGETPQQILNDVMSYFEGDRIRYSKALNTDLNKDSKGNKLEPEQKAYFEGTMLTDGNGNLMPIYHTSPALFTEFDPTGSPTYRFGNHVVNYYSNNEVVSGSYTNGRYKKFENSSVDDLEKLKEAKANRTKLYNERTDLELFVQKDDFKAYRYVYNIEKYAYKLLEQGKIDFFEYNAVLQTRNRYLDEMSPVGMMRYGNRFAKYIEADILHKLEGQEYEEAKELINYFTANMQKFESIGDKMREVGQEISFLERKTSNIQYEGYGLTKNPYIINGANANWNTLNKSDYKINVEELDSVLDDLEEYMDRYTISFDDEEKLKLSIEYTSRNRIAKNILQNVSEESANYLIENPIILTNLVTSIKDNNYYLKEDILEDIVDGKFDYRMETNNVVKSIIGINDFLEETTGEYHYYDGVIFQNITDSGSGIEGSDVPSDIIVLFDSNQFKDINNKKPTDNPDIRFSKNLDNSKINGHLAKLKNVELNDSNEVRGVLESILRDGEIGQNEYNAFIEKLQDTLSWEVEGEDINADLKAYIKNNHYKVNMTSLGITADKFIKNKDRSSKGWGEVGGAKEMQDLRNKFKGILEFVDNTNLLESSQRLGNNGKMAGGSKGTNTKGDGIDVIYNDIRSAYGDVLPETTDVMEMLDNIYEVMTSEVKPQTEYDEVAYNQHKELYDAFFKDFEENYSKESIESELGLDDGTLDAMLNRNLTKRQEEQIAKSRQFLVDNAPRWIPNYDILKAQYPNISEENLSEALFDLIELGEVKEEVKQRISDEMFKKASDYFESVSPEIMVEYEQEIKDLQKDALEYFMSDAEYKTNKKFLNAQAKVINTIQKANGELTENIEGIAKDIAEADFKIKERKLKDRNYMSNLASKLFGTARDVQAFPNLHTFDEILKYVTKGNTELAKSFNEAFMIPRHQAQAIANDIMSLSNDLIKETTDKGIKKHSAEDKAIQWLREGKTETGETYTEKECITQFGEKAQDIIGLSKKYGEFYDMLYEIQKNIDEDIYGEEYWQHYLLDTNKLEIQRNNTKQLLDQAKTELTLNNSTVNQARINTLTKDLERLDRTINVRHEQIANHDATRRQVIEYRANYMPHIQEQKGLIDQIGQILSGSNNVPTAISGKTANTKPKTMFANYLLRRKGGSYVASAIGGLEKYANQASKKIGYDPFISSIRTFENELRTLNGEQGSEFNNLARYLTQYADNLAQKTNPLDLALRDQGESIEKTIKILGVLASRAKANAVMGNLRSSAVQISNLPNGLSMLTKSGANTKDFSKGLLNAFTTNNVEKSIFLTNRFFDFNDSSIELKDNIKDMFAQMMQFGDKGVANIVWNIEYEHQLRLGKTEDTAIYLADNLTRRAIAGRGHGEVPLMMQSQILNFLLPFQIEKNNTWRLFKSEFGDAWNDVVKKEVSVSNGVQKTTRTIDLKALGGNNSRALVVQLASSFALASLFKSIFGDRIIFDLVGAIIEGIKARKEEDDDGTASYKIIGHVLGEIADQMYGMNYLLSLSGLDEDKKIQEYFGESSANMYGVTNIGLTGLGKAASSIANGNLPNAISDMLFAYGTELGGTQAQRMIESAQENGLLPQYKLNNSTEYMGQALEMDNWELKPYHRTASGKIGYINDPTDYMDVLKQMAFGKYTGKAAQEYLENGFKTINEDKLNALSMLKPSEANEVIKELNAIESVKDENGKTITNSKSALLRKKMEDLDIWDDYIANNPEDKFQISKTVREMSGAEFNEFLKTLNVDSVKKEEIKVEPEVKKSTLEDMYKKTFGNKTDKKEVAEELAQEVKEDVGIETKSTPKSTSISEISYDKNSKLLSVKFKSGKTYEYADISAKTWNEFKNAESVGSYFSKNIKSSSGKTTNKASTKANESSVNTSTGTSQTKLQKAYNETMKKFKKEMLSQAKVSANKMGDYRSSSSRLNKSINDIRKEVEKLLNK